MVDNHISGILCVSFDINQYWNFSLISMLALAPWKLHAVNLSLLRRGLHGYQISTKWNTYGRIWMCQTAPFISLIICQGTLTFWRRFCRPSTLLRSFFFLPVVIFCSSSCQDILLESVGQTDGVSDWLTILARFKKKKKWTRTFCRED